MTSVKKYSVVFVALAGLTTMQFAIEKLALHDFYWVALGVIMFVSTVKAVSVAGWYMHLFDEPRSISYVALAGVLGVVALTAGAAYSVVG